MHFQGKPGIIPTPHGNPSQFGYDQLEKLGPGILYEILSGLDENDSFWEYQFKFKLDTGLVLPLEPFQNEEFSLSYRHTTLSTKWPKITICFFKLTVRY